MDPIRFAEVAPSPVLEPFVENFWVLLSPGLSGKAARHPVFPDGGIDLVLAGPRAFMKGATLEAHEEFLGAPRAIVGARLRVGATQALFGAPGAALVNLEVNLADLGSMPSLAEQVALVASPTEAMRALEAALLTAAKKAAPLDPELTGAVRAIEAAHGDLRLDSRRLRRLFDRHLGLSPKQYCRLRRFHRCLDLARDGCRDWAGLAVEAGFYDQSHLIHDFLELGGTTPEKLFSEPPPVRFFQYPSLDAMTR